MKKFIMFMVAVFAIEMVCVASQKVLTSCGKRITTVDQSYFDDREDWENYMHSLNKVYCGDGTVSARPY